MFNVTSLEVRKLLEVNAAMFLDVMSDRMLKFDVFLANETRFRTGRWKTFTFFHRLLGTSLSFMFCGLAMSIVLFLAEKAFLADIALEVTHARFEEIPGFVGTF